MEGRRPVRHPTQDPTFAQQAADLARKSIEADCVAIEILVLKLSADKSWPYENYYTRKVAEIRVDAQRRPYEQQGEWSFTTEVCRAAWSAQIYRELIELDATRGGAK